jgi:hypothetical protein
VIASISIGFKVRLQKIREKENFQNNKHDEKLNQNNQPNLLSPLGHGRKTFGIEPEYFSELFHLEQSIQIVLKI